MKRKLVSLLLTFQALGIRILDKEARREILRSTFSWQMIVLLLGISYVHGQFRHSFLNIGYSYGDTYFENFRYSIVSVDTANNETSFGNYSGIYIKNQLIPLTMEAYGENVYFDLIFGFRGKTLQRPHAKSGDIVLKEGPTFTIKLALGDYLNDVIALYGGVQYNWNSIEYVRGSLQNLNTPESVSSDLVGDYYIPLTGGNQRGLGAYALFHLVEDVFAIRTGFMYDWIRRKNIKNNSGFGNYFYRGNAQTAEIALCLTSPDPKANFGIQLRGSVSQRTIKQEYMENTAPPVVPQHKLTTFNVSVLVSIPLVILSAFTAEAYD